MPEPNSNSARPIGQIIVHELNWFSTASGSERAYATSRLWNHAFPLAVLNHLQIELSPQRADRHDVRLAPAIGRRQHMDLPQEPRAQASISVQKIRDDVEGR